LKNLDKAITSFDKAISLDPKYDEALKNREYVKRLKKLAAETSNVNEQLSSFPDTDWKYLLHNIRRQLCLPFIGEEVSIPFLPFKSEIANEWAKEYDYPLEDSSKLEVVAQFLAVKEGYKEVPKYLLSEKLRGIKPPDFNLAEYRNTPPAVI
jgi:hypothetical protein